MQFFLRFFLLTGLIAGTYACGADLPTEVEQALAEAPEVVDFNQHIRPILSDRCWSCHGPDAEARKADLRLDNEQDAFRALSSGNGHALVAGKPGRSEAIARMVSDDPELVMPPPESKLTVSAEEIALLTKWISQGANWKKHWSLLPIANFEVPDNPAGYLAANPIDNFINRQLDQKQMPANEQADAERLLRRLCLDLTGLPPSPALMEQWLQQPDEAAYQALVDSLLQTTAHAERLSMEWLDLARYADSHGLHADGWRLTWPYRDWVINAFKENLPFDEFVRKQIAGDLVPAPKQEDLIPTAFNRMHPMTAEGGAIDEEFRLSYVFDRVNTVATGLLGLTMDCSRCHDHKFDPISQEEYYQFSAFFNNFHELGMTGDDGNFGPYLLLQDETTQNRITAYEASIASLETERASVTISAEELEQFLRTSQVKAPRPDAAIRFAKMRKEDYGKTIDGSAWSTDELSFVQDAERGQVGEFDHPYDDLYFAKGVGAIRSHEPLSAALFAKTTKRDSSLQQSLLCNAGEKNVLWRGWEFYLDETNHLNLRFIRTMPDDLFHVRSRDSIRLDQWYHLAFTYDGSGSANGVQLFIDGKVIEQRKEMDHLRGEVYVGDWTTMKRKETRKLRVSQSYRAYTGENGIFLGWLDDIQLFNKTLSPLEVYQLSGSKGAAPVESVKAHLRMRSPVYQAATVKIRSLQAERLPLMDTLPRLMISEEMGTPRQTFVLNRGAYDAPEQQVFPATPARILPFPADLPPNRDGLTTWLFLPEHPLTARVAVNRYWQLIFGEGLVATTHDFGSQGKLPSHPELLDYLATEFRESGWDIRALIRLMVNSETYRRSSHANPDQRAVDPANRWYARGPSGRLPAEMIRDNALAAAGLLHPAVGGASVRPYQPPGLWIQANSFSKMLLHYEADSGHDLYRRSMYTFMKRTAPPPFMTNFDATARDICVVKRSQTNTPLQALNLLNDPQFVEAARVLAQRVQLETSDVDQQLEYAFRLVTGRRAKEAEKLILTSLFTEELARFTADPAAATSLLAIGEYPFDDAMDPLQTAALASVGNTLFSFDEAYVKR